MIEQINHIADLWWSGAIAMFWQVSVLIILIGCVDIIIRRWAWPQLRYALWLMVLIKLILPPTISLSTSITSKLQPLARQIVARESHEENANTTAAMILAHLEAATAGPAVVATSSRDTVTERPPALVFTGSENVAGESPNAVYVKPIWQAYVMAIWLAGIFVLGGWLIIKLLHLRKEDDELATTASLPESFYDSMARCAKRLELRRAPKVVQTRRVACPAVFGTVRPVLLMPVGYLSKMTRRDTENMLLHEFAHIKRGDLWVHGFYMLLQIVYWYNPLLWLVRSQMHHLRELCCDATVARLLKDRTSEYRQTLIDVARRFLTKPTEPGLGLLGLFEDSNRLLVRLNWLKKETWRYQKMKKLTIVTTIVLMLAFVLPMAQAQDKPSTEESSADSVLAEDQPLQSQNIPAAEHEHQQNQEQLSQALQVLQAQLQQLQIEKQKLQHELHALEHARHAKDRAAQATLKAKQATLKAKEAKAKAAKIKIDAEAKKTDAEAQKVDAEARKAELDAKQWEQWAKQMEAWAANYKTWADSDEFKQWQKDIERWAQDLAKSNLRMRAGEPGPAPEPGPMPVMPPLPSMPVPVAPTAPMPLGVALPDVMDIVEDLPLISGYFSTVDMALTPSAEEVPLGKPGRDIEVKKDKSGKYVATTLMHFLAKAQPGKPFVVRNKLGGIILRPSKDGTCDVRARIRGTAKSPDQARAMVETVGMNLDSSEKRYYLEPVRHDGGKWDNLNVALHITVPPGVLLDVKTELGSVELRDLKGRIKAATNLGGIKAVNTTGDVELVTNLGDIEFMAPKDLSARLQVQTKMGSIKSDLPLDISKANMFQRKAEGTIGTGQGNVRMTTDMGSIRLYWQHLTHHEHGSH
ncbi:MAG: hypothetical protein CEE38_00670 [Planctomycetes bacterium B3_Pla]|nr:MAG: hypothetical protein CEE38_00670 [Planctomycetes bacterium B3_Pla]